VGRARTPDRGEQDPDRSRQHGRAAWAWARTLRRAGRSPERDALVFGTTTGGKESPSNVRNRLLRAAVERADTALVTRGRDRLPERLTPHSLRHTFASLLVAFGEDPGYVMDQMGHTDPTFTLRVYRKAMKRRDGEPDLLRALVGAEATTLADLDNARRNGQSEGNNGLPAEEAAAGGRAA